MIKLFRWYSDGTGTFFFAAKKLYKDYYDVIIRNYDTNYWTKGPLHKDGFKDYESAAKPSNKLCHILVRQIFDWTATEKEE